MEKIDDNPIRVDTTVQKDLPSVSNYFDPEIGEAPGVESAIEDMKKNKSLKKKR